MIELVDGWIYYRDPYDTGIKQKYYHKDLTELLDVRPQNGGEVFLPHTFNVGEHADEYRGPVWYQCAFEVQPDWLDAYVELKCNGIYRDADVWLNGEKVGQHYYDGFLGFALPIHQWLRCGKNVLTIRVDNRYSAESLPFFNYFDWADDGGIFRSVYLVIKPQQHVQKVCLSALPVSEGCVKKGSRMVSGRGKIIYEIRHTQPDENRTVELRYELYDISGSTRQCIQLGVCGEKGEIEVSDIRYWHFDTPVQYLFCVQMYHDGELLDSYEQKIGFRSFGISKNETLLNGEAVQLVGTEWMPGSDPRIGNAEKPSDMDRFLILLKGCNCVYTRVHWQQDDYFYDWCDEHGLLVQEEIPLWGSPKEPTEEWIRHAKSQIACMISEHGNHPSIVSWGIGNELDGQSPITHTYVEQMTEYVHDLDPFRPVSYVSNTAFEGPEDACAKSDLMMCNEYIGTWIADRDCEKAVHEFRSAHRDKPMIVSEFGLCEPAFSGGDKRREEIFLEKLAIYRRQKVDGFIWFCLNDYRTQMGEQYEGRFKQRIHGSTDCYGNPKPSYFAVKEACAPLELRILSGEDGQLQLVFTVKNALPRYMVSGYYALLFGGMDTPQFIEIPDGLPGEQMVIRVSPKSHRKLSVFRPNGEEVLSRWL